MFLFCIVYNCVVLLNTKTKVEYPEGKSRSMLYVLCINNTRSQTLAIEKILVLVLLYGAKYSVRTCAQLLPPPPPPHVHVYGGLAAICHYATHPSMHHMVSMLLLTLLRHTFASMLAQLFLDQAFITKKAWQLCFDGIEFPLMAPVSELLFLDQPTAL